MAITRPVTKTIISTTAWGVPITDEVNALRTELNALKPTAWVVIPLMNGWVNYGGPYPPVAVMRQGNLCTLRGLVQGGAKQTVVGNVPVGYRPPGNVETIVYQYTSGVSWSQMVVAANGDITFGGNTASEIGAVALAGPVWSI